MYHCELSVHIVSSRPDLAAALRQVPPPQRFTLRFASFSTADDEALSDCEVLVLDLPGRGAEDVLARLDAGVQVILCADAGTLAAAQAGFGLRCAELWLRPVDPAYAAARFAALLDRKKLQKDCYLAQTCLDTIIDSVPDLVWFKDIRGSHEKVNNAFCHAVGKSKQDVQGRGHYYIWDIEPDDYAKGEYVCLETEEEVLRKRRTCLFDEKVMSQHGLRQFKTYKSPIFGEDGETIGTVGIAHDVTDLGNIGTELEILLGSIPFAVVIEDSDGRIINTNAKFSEYFETDREAILGQNYETWKRRVLQCPDKINAEDSVEIVLTVNGTPKTLEIREEPIFDIFHTQVGRLCICQDVTGERAMAEQIIHNSNTDFMTGLYNRRYFYEYLHKNRGDQPVSLIYLDLDHFKGINDTFGHQAGDEALILTAKLLQTSFPEGFIARLGGDEFLITLLGVWPPRDLQTRSNQLLAHLEHTFRSSTQLKGLTASIGIAQSDDSDMKIDTLLQQSDMALYAAKQHGRARCWIYDSPLNNTDTK